jgi:hypothetical protein
MVDISTCITETKGLRRVRDYGLLRGHEKKQLQLIQYALLSMLSACHAIGGDFSTQIKT